MLSRRNTERDEEEDKEHLKQISSEISQFFLEKDRSKFPKKSMPNEDPAKYRFQSQSPENFKRHGLNLFSSNTNKIKSILKNNQQVRPRRGKRLSVNPIYEEGFGFDDVAYHQKGATKVKDIFKHRSLFDDVDFSNSSDGDTENKLKVHSDTSILSHNQIGIHSGKPNFNNTNTELEEKKLNEIMFGGEPNLSKIDQGEEDKGTPNGNIPIIKEVNEEVLNSDLDKNSIDEKTQGKSDFKSKKFKFGMTSKTIPKSLFSRTEILSPKE